jgi:hypothetical protein
MDISNDLLEPNCRREKPTHRHADKLPQKTAGSRMTACTLSTEGSGGEIGSEYHCSTSNSQSRWPLLAPRNDTKPLTVEIHSGHRRNNGQIGPPIWRYALPLHAEETSAFPTIICPSPQQNFPFWWGNAHVCYKQAEQRTYDPYGMRIKVRLNEVHERWRDLSDVSLKYISVNLQLYKNPGTIDLNSFLLRIVNIENVRVRK